MGIDDRLEAYRRAVRKLEEIMNEPPSEINRDSAIKRFEMCFELAWKLIKDFLREKGVICRAPGDCLQEAFSYGLIT